jgi:hypothetical protein
MLGFLPGVPYLGDLPEQLELPRRKDPRQEVPAGAVAIATRLSLIYSAPSPGNFPRPCWWSYPGTRNASEEPHRWRDPPACGSPFEAKTRSVPATANATSSIRWAFFRNITHPATWHSLAAA